MSERESIGWDELDAETQHELVSLAEKLGEETPEQNGGRTASRREFLGAITAAGLGGSLLSQGADRAFEDFVSPASAGTQSVAQFGEAGEPFDFVAEDIYGPGGQGSGDAVNFESVSATDLESTGTSTGTDRSAWTSEPVTITVDESGGGDFTTVQKGLDSAVAMMNLHPVTVQIEAGDYSGEGTHIVPPAVTAYIDRSSDSESDSLNIVGRGASNSDVKTAAFVVDGQAGFGVDIGGVEIQGPDTATNEAAAVSAYGAQHLKLGSIDIAGSGYDNLIVSYASNIQVNNMVTLLAGADCTNMVHTKQSGTFMVNPSNGDIVNNGTVNGNVLRPQQTGGAIIVPGTLSAVTDLKNDIYVGDGGAPVYYNDLTFHPDGDVSGEIVQSITSGTGKTVTTDIPVRTSAPKMFRVTHFNYSGSVQDTEVRLFSSRTGTDAQLHRDAQAGEMTNVSLSTDANNYLQITANWSVDSQLYVETL